MIPREKGIPIVEFEVVILDVRAPFGIVHQLDS